MRDLRLRVSSSGPISNRARSYNLSTDIVITYYCIGMFELYPEFVVTRMYLVGMSIPYDLHHFRILLSETPYFTPVLTSDITLTSNVSCSLDGRFTTRRPTEAQSGPQKLINVWLITLLQLRHIFVG